MALKVDGDKLKLRVGEEEKEFSEEDLLGLLNQSSDLQGKLKQAEAVFKMAERYGTDIETLARQADGSFALVSKLLDEGVINEKGEVIAKPGPSEPPGNRPPGNPTPPWPPGDRDTKVGEDKIMEIVQKALGETLKPVTERLQSLEGDLTSMTEDRLRRQLKQKHPELNDREITWVFQQAMSDRRKNLWEHAEEFAGEKKGEYDSLRKKYAEEFGVNLEAHDRNRLNQQDGLKGPAAVVQGKKISFQKGRGEENTVTPFEATKEFFSKQANEGE